MGIVAFDTIARRAGMLNLLFLDLLRFLSVASQAELFRRSGLQHHLSILGFLVTSGTGGLPGFIRRMHKHQLQLRPGGLVRIVAAKATCGHKGLPLVSLDQLGILRIMTIQAQARGVFLQLEIEFPLAFFSRPMNVVANIATLI